MNVDFYSEFNPLKTLEIKDIGKCAIEGVNPDGFYFYLVIITVRGVAHMFTCGPLIPDLDDLPPGYTVNYSTINFNIQKLKKTVSAWLNGRKPGKSKPINEAKLVDIDYAISQFKNIKSYVALNPDFVNAMNDDESEDFYDEEDEF